MDLTIQDLINRMPEAFLAERATGIDATIQLHLTGDQGNDWVVYIQNCECKVEPGIIEKPKLNLTAKAQDCLDIFTGKLDPIRAFMQGRLKITGDYGLAMKLSGLFVLNK